MGWGDPVEAFPWPVVELRGNGGEGLGAVNAEVAVLREVLPEQWSGPRKLDYIIKVFN